MSEPALVPVTLVHNGKSSLSTSNIKMCYGSKEENIKKAYIKILKSC